MWHGAPRDLIAAAGSWQKWALYDCSPLKQWGKGPVTLLGDAAHPMLPYLAQGAAMAIEDAAVLAQCLAQSPDNATAALRSYEGKRQKRTARAQRAARRNGTRLSHGRRRSVPARDRAGGDARYRTAAAVQLALSLAAGLSYAHISGVTPRILPWIITCTAIAIGRQPTA